MTPQHTKSDMCTACQQHTGAPIPQPLADRRENGQLPETFPVQDTLKSEGATFSWLHSHIQRLYLWATCAEQGNHAEWQAPHGWDLQK